METSKVFLVTRNNSSSDREIISTHLNLSSANKIASDYFKKNAPNSADFDYDDDGCFYSWDDLADLTVTPLDVID